MTKHKNSAAADLLEQLDLGSSIAEQDTLLQAARVETSASSDLLHDKVDLVPGTKGSGKSALFRVFVDFLPDFLFKHRKVVVAHGVQKYGDSVFHAYKDEFAKLSEDDFVAFWCIYLTSLAHEQFVKCKLYKSILAKAQSEVDEFRRACFDARIPEIQKEKSLKDILGWALAVLKKWRPHLAYHPPGDCGEVTLDLFGKPVAAAQSKEGPATTPPLYAAKIRDTLEQILRKTNLSIWLMVDRLDEIFPRRSTLERRALRGLLRCMNVFASEEIRIKLFLRDDMLAEVVSGPEGFTALTHVSARQADTLRWPEDQILTMLVKRLFANDVLATYLKVNKQRLDASQEYRAECFYKVFPSTVHSGPKQSPTLRWIYTHTKDGNDVVTPRDVLDLITKAKQSQQDEFRHAPNGESPWLIGQRAIIYGWEELSTRKRDTYLKAEFPHLWPQIEKFVGGKTEYSERSLRDLLGRDWEQACKDFVSIGLLSKQARGDETTFTFPFVYRKGLDLTQGHA